MEAEEITPLVHARVPLFLGSVPNSGNLQDAVTAALAALVAEKGIAGARIVAVPRTSSTSSAAQVAYSLETPSVVIRSVSLQGISPALRPSLDTFLASQKGLAYQETITRNALASGLTGIYRDSGYLDARLASLTYVAPAVVNNSINLDLTGDISEGQPYRVSTFTWSGSDVFSAADFAKATKLSTRHCHPT